MLSGKRIIKNYAMLATAYSISRLAMFIAIVYLARKLGVAAFGQVNFVQALLVYFTLLTHVGLMTVGTREVSRSPDRIKELVSSILFVRILLATLAFVLLVAFMTILDLTARSKLLALLFGVSLFPTALILDWPFKGTNRMAIVAWIEVLRVAAYVIGIFCTIRGDEQMLWIPVWYFVALASTAIFSIIVFLRMYGGFVAPEREFCLTALKRAAPLGLAFIMVQVYYLSDTVLLGFLKGDMAVGYYSPAYRIVAFVQGLGGWYFESLFPTVSRLYKYEPDNLLFVINSSLRSTIVLGIPIGIVGVLFARWTILLFYGQAYLQAAPVLQILLVAIIVELVGMNFGYALMACDYSKKYLTSVSVGALASVALNLVLIPRWGTSGAASARLISEAIIAILFARQFRSVMTSRSGQTNKPAFSPVSE